MENSVVTLILAMEREEPGSERTSDPEEDSVLGFLPLCLSTLDAVQLSA